MHRSQKAMPLCYQEMLKEKKVPPFAKWDKELPKIFADSRFKVSQCGLGPHF